MASTRTAGPARDHADTTGQFGAGDASQFSGGDVSRYPAVLLQITDTHLFSSVDTTQRGINTQASLDAVLDHARADPRWPPDAIVVTGDIVHDESRDGYLRFRKILETLGPPAFCVPGNHDDPVALAECLSAPQVQVCGDTQLGTWRVILLSTFGDGEVAGALGSAELARLEATLEEYPGEHTLICMHHPPIPMGSAW
ncbi:MAG: metallophosphoesterase, partial [Rhodospirillaceae bacterium]|nr:metallophosphoesterase [Rhodospirillaceae bacterium]